MVRKTETSQKVHFFFKIYVDKFIGYLYQNFLFFLLLFSMHPSDNLSFFLEPHLKAVLFFTYCLFFGTFSKKNSTILFSVVFCSKYGTKLGKGLDKWRDLKISVIVIIICRVLTSYTIFF